MTRAASVATRILLALAALALPATVPARQPAPAATTAQSAAAFEQLKSLVGTWRNADNPASPLRVTYYITAGGTVLVEEWRRGTQPHSLTLYHRDGPALLATHYCPQGNQPRLMLAAGPGKPLRFTFRDATDLDRKTEAVQHDLSFDLSNPARPVRSETYRSAKGDESDRLVLVRGEGPASY